MRENEGRLRGAAMAERIREALEDAFEQEVRDHLLAGKEAPVERLHDYLTGVADHHEPRVRLLFELFEDGTLNLGGQLADVPATCFFLGDSVRYQRSLEDWVRILGPSKPFVPAAPDVPPVLELWSAGDLLWRASRASAQASREFLTVLTDQQVGLWRVRVRVEDLRVVATDVWSGSDAYRVIVDPGALEGEQVLPGALIPHDRPLTPLPRLASRC